MGENKQSVFNCYFLGKLKNQQKEKGYDIFQFTCDVLSYFMMQCQNDAHNFKKSYRILSPSIFV